MRRKREWCTWCTCCNTRRRCCCSCVKHWCRHLSARHRSLLRLPSRRRRPSVSDSLRCVHGLLTLCAVGALVVVELNNNNNTVHDDDDVPPPAVQRRRTSATTSQTTRTTTRVKPTSVPVGDEPGPVGAGSDGLSVRLAQEPPVETVIFVFFLLISV